MKNIEKYEKEISKLVNEGNALECSIATVSGKRKEKPCVIEDCHECAKKCIEWMYSEYKEDILSDDEKDIIKSMIYVIQKIGCTVTHVRKHDNGYGEAYIGVNYTNEKTGFCGRMETPWFKNDKFKGMEPNKGYTLKELGIELEK